MSGLGGGGGGGRGGGGNCWPFLAEHLNLRRFLICTYMYIHIRIYIYISVYVCVFILKNRDPKKGLPVLHKVGHIQTE